MGDNISTVEGIQYSGGYLQYSGVTSVQWGDNISTVEGIQYSGGYLQYSGDNISTVGDNISTVEVAQYSGDKNLKYYEFSKNLEIFSRAYFASKSDRPHHGTQFADHG